MMMVYRYYVGSAPRVTVADVELLKVVLVKEFDNFHDRGWLVSASGYYGPVRVNEIRLHHVIRAL